MVDISGAGGTICRGVGVGTPRKQGCPCRAKALGKQSEKERQYEIEMAASEQRQQEINRHRQQGHLTDKEALLVRLAFNEWIKLPLAKSYREKVDNADQVFMDFVRFAVTQKSEVQPRQHKDKTKMKPTEKRSHSHGTARSPGVGARQDTSQPPAQGVPRYLQVL